MKKLTTLLFAGLLSIVMVNTADAQFEVGGGLVFGTGVYGVSDVDNDLGIRAEGRYTINEQISAGADFTFFFPKSESGIDFKFSTLNFNGFYDFLQEDGLNVYGLAGINVAFLTIEVPGVTIPGGGTFGGETSTTEVGLNLGGGVEYALDFANLFGELKYVVSDADQLVIAAGLRFPLGD